jgi:hypothetical protein
MARAIQIHEYGGPEVLRYEEVPTGKLGARQLRIRHTAIGVEPTNDTAATPGWVIKASTASLSPCTTLNTPSGSPASVSSSATNCDVEGSFSDGFRMNVFPQAIAIGYIHIGTIVGKLNGVIPTTTPKG